MNTAQKVQRVAQALANVMTQSKNIKVTISGTVAYRTPGRINVPAGDFTQPDVVTMTRGYIDHELGHEKHTDSDVFSSVARLSPTHHHFINCVEDVRMERAVGNEFTGAKANLRRLAKVAIDKGLFGEPCADMPAVKLVQALVLYRGRYRVIGQECLRELASLAELSVRDILYDNLTDQVCDLVDSIADAETTTDSKAIALAIIKLLEDAQEDAEDDSDDSDSEQSDGDQSDDDDADDADNGDSDDSDSQDDSDDSGSEQSDGDQGDHDETDDANGDTSDAADDDTADPSDADGAADDNDGSKSLQQVIEDILSAAESDGMDDIHEMIADELEQHAEQSDDPLGELAGMMPSPLSTVRRPRLNNRFDEQKAKSVGKRVFQKMSRVLIDEDDSLNVTRKVGNRINSRRLAGVSAGNDRLFNRRLVKPDTSAAISFVIDASGSMMAQMAHANEVAYAMCHGLSQSNLATEVAYFSVYNNDNEVGVHYAKSFDDKHINPMHFRTIARFGTPTGPAMLSAASRLGCRDENKKILFVITDGESNDASEVIWARQFAEKLGIKVVPIGLNTDCVDGFSVDEFKNVTSLDELPGAINHAIKAKLFA